MALALLSFNLDVYPIDGGNLRAWMSKGRRGVFSHAISITCIPILKLILFNGIITKEMKNSNLFLLSTHYCENFKNSFVYGLVSYRK